MKRRKAQHGLPAGKLPIRVLDRLLKRYVKGGKGVIIGASIGMDSAVIRRGTGYLLAKTDPITFVAEDIGIYTIHINANDIAVMGGVPKWFLATVLVPEGARIRDVERIFQEISTVCESIDIAFCGGHTEVTAGIDRPIVIGQMLGEVNPQGLLSPKGIRPGDHLILTKGIALEAASIIARLKDDKLKGHLPRRLINRCRNFVKDPGISVLRDARIAIRCGRIHAMHDPTEGGLSTALHELSMASGYGILVEKDLIPLIPESKRLCDFMGIDIMGAIASGSLLMAVHPMDTGKIIKGLERSGIRASFIGRVTGRKRGVKIMEDGKTKTLKPFERDEITRIF